MQLEILIKAVIESQCIHLLDLLVSGVEEGFSPYNVNNIIVVHYFRLVVICYS